MFLEPDLVNCLSAYGNSTIGFCRWIPEHGDTLIRKLAAATNELAFVDLGFFAGQQDQETRMQIMRSAVADPLAFRRNLLAHLRIHKSRGLAGVVLTLDWPAAMREIVFACRTLEIPTFLVPHESVFSDEQDYFRDRRRGVDTPACDFVLCWGELQRRIFSARGYPEHRLIKLGSPKLDHDANYRRDLSPEIVRRLFGFGGNDRIVLFAMQPMDNFGNRSLARKRQAAAISDALDCCEAKGASLLVRVPPSRDRIIPDDLLERLRSSSHAALDEPGPYLLTPEEAISHSDAVLSTNSTMLFEALLMGVPAIATRYIPFASIWDNVSVAVATNRAELSAGMDQAFKGGRAVISPEGMSWAVKQFSDGLNGFDGNAAKRITDFIAAKLKSPYDPLSISLDDEAPALRPGVICCSPGAMALRRNSGDMAIRARSIVPVGSVDAMAAADLFVRLEGESTPDLEQAARLLGRPVHVWTDATGAPDVMAVAATDALS